MSAPRIRLAGTPEGFDAVLLAGERARQDTPLLHVARDDARMARLAEALAFFAPGVPVLQFPAWDCLPYDRVGPNAEITARRVATLARLADNGAARAIVLTTVNALCQKVPPPEAFRGASLTLARGRKNPPQTLIGFLGSHGYIRAGTVMEPGEYAVRGGLVDLWPAGREEPVRLDFFGDELEAIRPFDPLSQRSSGSTERLELRPVSEVPLDAGAVARFREAWRELFGSSATEDPLYLAISERRRFDGMEHWVSLFHPAMATLLDYLPGARVSFDHEADGVLETRLETIAEHFDARRSSQAASVAGGETPYRPVPPVRLYLDQRS
ncbi:MAG: transcription-repair coupling factor, partial [Acetobacteraceae bacterium]|nr:transcription-repair coupling factor [Acetobacteraceae bacterium]